MLQFLSIDQCQLPKVEGPCRGDFRQWYYDQNSDRCFQFRYGGCQGNSNRFHDRQSCESRCARNVITTAASPLIIAPVRPSDVCLAPLDPGPCLQNVGLIFFILVIVTTTFFIIAYNRSTCGISSHQQDGAKSLHLEVVKEMLIDSNLLKIVKELAILILILMV